MTTRHRIHAAGVVLALGVTVATALGAQRAPTIQRRVTLDPAKPVAFHAVVTPDTVYVGEQATYEMGVFITEAARARMRRNPEVLPAELRGLLAYDLGGPQSLPALTVQGTRIEPHVLQRAFFPLAPGVLEIAAPQLSYALPRSASYFAREESAVIRAEDVRLVVRPLPEAGRPADFDGAVGTWEVELVVAPDGGRGTGTTTRDVDGVRARGAATVTAGEPLVVAVRVRGAGNVRLAPRPRLAVPGANVVEAGETLEVDSTGAVVRGEKHFEWLVTPERAGALVIPPVRYPFFDPSARAYRVASTRADTLRVVGTGVVAATLNGAPGDADRAPLRRTDRGALDAPLVRTPLFWLVLLLAPVPAIVAWWRARRASRAEAAQDAAHAAPAPPAIPRHRASPERERATSRRRDVRNALAARLAVDHDVIADPEVLRTRLRHAGVTRETTDAVVRAVLALDRAAFAPDTAGATAAPAAPAASTGDDIDGLLACVHAEAMPREALARDALARTAPGTRGARARRSSAVRAGLTRLILLLGAGTTIGVPTAHAAQPPSFADALALADARDDAAASAAFLAIAESAPRHADAWANAGTTAWRAADTATAVRAWQRALRLEPTASDVRRQLAEIAPASRTGFARVPALPRSGIAWVALVLWGLGWLLLAAHAATRPTRRAGLAVLFLAVVALGATWAWEHRLAGAALSIVQRAETLRAAAGSDAAARGMLARGDVVRRLRAPSPLPVGWRRVVTTDGREGWVPAAGIAALRP